MLNNILIKISPPIIVNFFSEGHEQTVKIKQNIFVSFLLKGFSILISLALVPVTLNYLGTEKYGIWLTLSSVIAWMSFFDIGLGNGLRNKLAETLSKDKIELAKTYVSTTYASLVLIVSILFIFFLIANPLLNWSWILNAPLYLSEELKSLAFFVLTFFLIRFVLKLVGTILIADQRPAVNDSFNVISNFLSFVVICLIAKTETNSILYVGITLSAMPVLILILASIYFFSGKYRFIYPSFSYVRFEYFKDLASLGGRFFLIQMAAIVLFSTDNIIISQILGPKEVTPYNIAFKYFSIVTMLFAIILTPFWSAFTHAYHKGDFIWIKNSTRKLIIASALFSMGVILLIIFSNFAYRIWVGENIKIPILLSISMGFFVIIQLFSAPFTYFINGVGKIQLQVYTAVIAGLINIPLSIYFAKYLNLGNSGVILATCVCNLSSIILWPIQYFKIINKKAYGIWSK